MKLLAVLYEKLRHWWWLRIYLRDHKRSIKGANRDPAVTAEDLIWTKVKMRDGRPYRIGISFSLNAGSLFGVLRSGEVVKEEYVRTQVTIFSNEHDRFLKVYEQLAPIDEFWREPRLGWKPYQDS